MKDAKTDFLIQKEHSITYQMILIFLVQCSTAETCIQIFIINYHEMRAKMQQRTLEIFFQFRKKSTNVAYILSCFVHHLYNLKIEHRNTPKMDSHDSNTLKSQKGRFNQLQTCGPYVRQQRVYYRILIIMFPALFLAHILITYKLITNDTQFIEIDNKILIDNLNYLNEYAFFAVLILKVFIFGITFTDIILSREKINKTIILQFIAKGKIYLRLMIQIDFYCSSLILLVPNPFNIVNFFVSIAIISFAFIFLQNYYNLKDPFYCKSFEYLLILRMIITFATIANCVAILAEANINILILCHIVASIMIVVMYFKSGWIIYSDKILGWGLIIFITLYLCISFNLYIYKQKTHTFSAFSINTSISFLVILYHFFLRVTAKINQTITKKQIDENESSVVFDFFGQSQNEEDKMMISAFLKFHSEEGCLNHNCYSNHRQSYDNQRKASCKNQEYVTQRQPLLKLYVLCRYDQYIKEHKNDFNTILNYCQFLYWRVGNVGRCMFWLEYTKNNIHNLDLSSLIRFNGLLDIVRKENNKFCDFLFDGKIDVEHLINAEKIYDNTSTEMYSILMDRLEVWKMIQYREIDLSKIRQILQPTFHKASQLSQSWIQISKYLKLSNQWKEQFLFFLLFIKNQKMKSRILEQFDASINISIDLQQFSSVKKSAFDLKSLLDVNTCCIHVFLNDGNALMKKVSKNFTNVTKYSIIEAANANIDLLLPKTAKYYHHQMLEKMSSEGRFTDERIYKPIEVYFSDKSGYLVPAFKIFKEFVTENGELEYVCLLKKIQQKQVTILCDERFQIDAFTNNLIDRLDIGQQNRKYLSHFNLISMMPNLASSSMFSYEAEAYVKQDQRQQIELVADSPKLFKYERSLTRRLSRTSVLSKEKTVSQTSLYSQFYYTRENLYEHLTLYKYNMKSIQKGDKQAHYRLIKAIQKKIKEFGDHFQCEVVLNQISNSYCKYYEVKIVNLNTKKCANTLNEITNQAMSEVNLPHQNQQNEFRRAFSGPTMISNIFIKENGNQPPSNNRFLQALKTAWVLYCIQLGISSLVKMLTLINIADDINNYHNNVLYTIELSIASSTLTSYYQAILLNVVTPSEIHLKILELTTKLENIINADSMKMVIFQESINRPAQYYPIVINDRNKGISYNQIDFLYFGESVYQTLSIDSNIALQSSGYQQMEEYYYPAYSNFINSAQNNLHDSYRSFASALTAGQIIFFFVSCVAFVIVGVIAFINVKKFRKSTLEMVKIHCYFNPTDIEKIIQYYKKIISIYNNMQKEQYDTNKDEKTLGLSFTKSHESETEQKENKENNNLNKKSKDIKKGTKQSKKDCVLYTKLISSFVILFTYTISQIFYVGDIINPISQLEQSAYKLFFYVPTYVDTGLIIANRHLQSNSRVDDGKYIDILISTNNTGQTPYMSTPKLDTDFFDAVQTIYFIDSCDFGEKWLLVQGFTLNDCQTTAGMSFSRGLRAYINFQWEKISELYYNKERNMTVDEIKDYYRSIWMANVFVRGLINMWNYQFMNQQTYFLSTLKTSTSVSIILFTIILIVVYFCLFNKLDQEYNYSRQFYGKMMPEFIVAGEKIIKSKLSVFGFL